MNVPARNGLLFGFGLSLGGYFIGLVLLQQLAFVLAPIPVAANFAAHRPDRAKVYILAAALAGIAGMAIGAWSTLAACILYSVMGLPVGRAILNRMAYRPLVMRLIAFVFVTQVILINLQWEQVMLEMKSVLEFYQGRLEGPEAGALTDQQTENLNTIIGTLENWPNVYIGFSFAGVLMGVCVSIGWTYRAVRRRTDLNPVGSFSDFRPHEATVWVVIAAALLAFANSYWLVPWLQMLCLNAAIGLFALYWLNGLSILLYGFDALKPNPILAVVFLLVMFLFGGIAMLSVVGLFDTWGEFRKRIDARVQAAIDSDDRVE